MTERRALGGWLQGPGSVPSGPSGDDRADYPGQRLGRPADGPGAMAGFGRRVVGLAIDWGFALLIGAGLLRPLDWGQFAPLAALLVMHAALVGAAGFTVGHRVMGLRVERVEQPVDDAPRMPPGLVRGLIRAVLLCLAVPPLLTDRDNRGLHDRLAGTVVVRR